MKRFNDKIRSTRLVASLGKDLARKFHIVWILWWFPIRRRLGFANTPVTFCLKLKGRECAVNLNGSHDEFLILEEIFGQEDYAVAVNSPQVIFDIGGNIGLSALYYAHSYPNATVHSFEPSPNTYQRLLQNVQRCKNVTPHQLAVAGTNGLITFYDNPEKSIASSLTRREEEDAEVTVEGYTLESIMKKCKVDYIDILKFDIEGAEEVMFKNFSMFNRVGYVIGELHEDLMSNPAEQLLSLLRSHFDLKVEPAGKSGRYIVEGPNRILKNEN